MLGRRKILALYYRSNLTERSIPLIVIRFPFIPSKLVTTLLEFGSHGIGIFSFVSREPSRSRKRRFNYREQNLAKLSCLPRGWLGRYLVQCYGRLIWMELSVRIYRQYAYKWISQNMEGDYEWFNILILNCIFLKMYFKPRFLKIMCKTFIVNCIVDTL